MLDILSLQRREPRFGWRAGKLSDFLLLKRGVDITEKQTRTGAIPVYSSSGISYYHSQAISEGPGVVTGRKGIIGKVFYVDGPFWPHDTTLWVTDFCGNLPEYVWRFLEACRLERFDEASSVPTLNRNNILSRYCVFPPYAEQHKIAEILRTWNEASEKLNQLIELRRSYYIGLRDRMISWTSTPRKKLRALVQPVVREVPKPNEAYTAISIRSHGKGTFVRLVSDPTTVDMDTLYVAREGDLIVNITFAWEGAIALVPAEHDGCLVSHRFPMFIPKQGTVCPRYLRHTVRMPRFTYFLALVSPGGAGRNRVLNKSDFLDLEIPAPDFGRQKEIASLLDAAEDAIAVTERYRDALNRQKRGLMQKLLTGEWRVIP